MTSITGFDEDLALRRPGTALLAQAEAARQAAPVRTALGRVMRVHTPARAWRLGAAGEVRVGAQLDTLAQCDPRWHVVHSVPVGSRGSDIDHVAIGPAGVFTINTKHHPGGRIWVAGDTVKVNGLRLAYIRTSRHEAERASRLLSDACGFAVPVTPLIVFVNAEQVTIKESPHDVHVLTRRALRRWLRRRPELLTTNGEAIFDRARRSSTWIE